MDQLAGCIVQLQNTLIFITIILLAQCALSYLYLSLSCPFLSVLLVQMPSGSFSPYGGELHALLLYMAQHKEMEGKSWTSFLAKYFKETYPGTHVVCKDCPAKLSLAPDLRTDQTQTATCRAISVTLATISITSMMTAKPEFLCNCV
jgi:hypothetical protein